MRKEIFCIQPDFNSSVIAKLSFIVLADALSTPLRAWIPAYTAFEPVPMWQRENHYCKISF